MNITTGIVKSTALLTSLFFAVLYLFPLYSNWATLAGCLFFFIVLAAFCIFEGAYSPKQDQRNASSALVSLQTQIDATNQSVSKISDELSRYALALGVRQTKNVNE
jgi:uncharacterized protein YpmB